MQELHAACDVQECWPRFQFNVQSAAVLCAASVGSRHSHLLSSEGVRRFGLPDAHKSGSMAHAMLGVCPRTRDPQHQIDHQTALESKMPLLFSIAGSSLLRS